jgi:anti-sigma regulatory factor (Ser/Thr protein kinase)
MQPRGEIPGAGADGQVRHRPAGALSPSAPARPPAAFGHAAVRYRTSGEYSQAAGDFVRAGLEAGDAVMVAVPGAHGDLIRACLGPLADRVSFAEMTELGRNPARIIPAIEAFAGFHPGQVLRYVGEPDWPSRTAPERAEVLRHEALLNLAFDSGTIQILCPYDVGRLGPEVISLAERTHPVLMRDGAPVTNPGYGGPWPPAAADRPLPGPPSGTPVLTYRDDPAAARQFAKERAAAAGLTEPKLTDLVIAVGELAANTLRHTGGDGSVRVWAAAGEVLCEVRDGGYIRDALAGRRCPPADAGQGHGLWVVHQVCDLVEMRTGTSGTVFRLHMGL